MTSRWDFKMTDDFKINAIPDVEKMMSFVMAASKELQEKIMNEEEKLVLTAVSEKGLERLIVLCKNELKRRNGY